MSFALIVQFRLQPKQNNLPVLCNLSTVPVGCCRLCIRHGNGASGQIPKRNSIRTGVAPLGNKSPMTQVDSRKTDHGKRVSEGSEESIWSLVIQCTPLVVISLDRNQIDH
ncbi:hypothetical protein AVEN_95499-1 [Araneus ventricosus]|uniref:Uncharacterized protein n=1 Tax=Araneus ventricosus TaxID=182803 RepID=A0A4Y2IQ12_ARAVE|nr:hypothetical protein AVEN_46655-1 [Araneus ventricosus]GBM79733.1 hypothetical protein AVEN_53666-1 [Araneus ventricosus]GBM79740.1 hypothetical protein AVEN_66066-1 [Araneus ventricosus]GBM79754.1 hypothetical protein AVEN_95499-1 [Araneus ventricosus]